jgi:hypothetical protein
MLGDYPELAGVVTERPAPWEKEPPPAGPVAAVE